MLKNRNKKKVVNKTKEELPWNVDEELELTAQCWEAFVMDTEVGRDWGRECEEGNKALNSPWEECWKSEEGILFTGPWTKSLNSSSSCTEPWDDGWTCVWEERPKVLVVEEEEEDGKGIEAEASTGPWKSLNSSLSPNKAAGWEWVVTDECDGDDSAKWRNNDNGTRQVKHWNGERVYGYLWHLEVYFIFPYIFVLQKHYLIYLICMGGKNLLRKEVTSIGQKFGKKQLQQFLYR